MWGIWHRGKKFWIVYPCFGTRRQAELCLSSLTAGKRDQPTRYLRLCAIVLKEDDVESVQESWDARD